MIGGLMAEIVRWGQGLLTLALMALLIGTVEPSTAVASLHTYHEQPGQTTYRSQLTLPDRQDRAWQAVLFYRGQGERPQGIYLRLIGFPGIRVDESRPLIIRSRTGQQWIANASEDFLPNPHPGNIGQYNFAAVLSHLNHPIPLTLDIPVLPEGVRHLVAAPFVVAEWKSLTERMETLEHPDRNLKDRELKSKISNLFRFAIIEKI